MLGLNRSCGHSLLLVGALAGGFFPLSGARAQAPVAVREHIQTGDRLVRVKVISSRNDMVSGGDAQIGRAHV